MRGTRGQLTIFVLLGIVLLAILIILLLVRQHLTRNQSGNDDELTQRFNEEAIEEYVYACIDFTAEEAFQKIGRRGGLLFTSEGGLHQSVSTPRRLEASVTLPGAGQETISFGLMDESGYAYVHPSGVRPKLPHYPFYQKEIADLPGLITGGNPHFNGAFGRYALPRLCDPDGPNRLDEENTNFQCDNTIVGSPRYTHAPTIQESLAAYLRNGITDCVDPAMLSQQLGATVQLIDPAAVNVSVLFTDQQTMVELTLPLRFSGDQSTLSLLTFQRAYPVRLHRIFSYLHHFLHKASRDPFFQLRELTQEDYSSIQGYDRFVTMITPLPPANAEGRSDLLLLAIDDPASSVKGKTYLVETLIQNRRPILSHVEDFIISSQPHVLTITVLDPDGDEIDGSTDIDLTNVPTTSSSMLTSYLSDSNEMASPPSHPEAEQFRLEIEGLPVGTREYNLSIQDEMGRKDWQLVDITVSS